MFLLWCQQDLIAAFWNHGGLAPSSSPSAPSLRSGFKPCSFPAALLHLLSSRAPECYPRGGCSTAGFLLAATICCCWLRVVCPAPAPRQPVRTLRSAYPNRQARHRESPGAPLPDRLLPPPLRHSESDLCISPSVLTQGTPVATKPPELPAPSPPSSCASFPLLHTLPSCT